MLWTAWQLCGPHQSSNPQMYDTFLQCLQAALKEAEASLALLTAQQEELQTAATHSQSANASSQTQLTSLQQVSGPLTMITQVFFA